MGGTSLLSKGNQYIQRDSERITEPWGTSSGTHVQSRYLLHRELKGVSVMAAPRMLSAATEWLSQHLNFENSTYVLAPLLARSDLGDHSPRAISLAMAWLEQFPRISEAQFVFNPLLARSDLGDQTLRAINLSIAWLEKFLHKPDAGFVLKPLLARSDLGDHAPRALSIAMAWLEKFLHIPEAEFVFKPLLARTDLGGYAPRAIKLSMVWLEAFPHMPEAQFIFNPLLARADLGDQAPRAINLAMAWLKKFPHLPDVEFILKRLFGRKELNVAQRSLCLLIAIPHVKKMGSAAEASHLLKGCLRDRSLDAQSARLVLQYGLAWIKSNPREPGADFVFNRLLTRPELPDDDWIEIADIALEWLRMYTSKANRDLSLASLLMRTALLREPDLIWVIEEVRQWLRAPPGAARKPKKLLKQLRYFNRLQGSCGELFPDAALYRWKPLCVNATEED